MLATIVAALIGSIVTGVIVWVRGWFTSKSVDTTITERIEAVEAQAEIDRKKRLDDLNVETNKIIADNDAAAALSLLRKRYSGPVVSGSNS